MLERKHLRPAEGLRVPDPAHGGHLPEEGRVVNLTSYWLRRLADGDVLEGEGAAKATKKPTPAKS